MIKKLILKTAVGCALTLTSFAQPGSLDLTFDPGTGANGAIMTHSIQSDGKIIIGGMFDSYNGTLINRIARLNNDGTLDPTFSTGTGADNTIWTSCIQSDGKIIIGGVFTSYNGVQRNHIARLNTDGTNDATFITGTGANGDIWNISIQNDGKIIIGGSFTSYNGTPRNHIARLNTDGNLDATFNPGAGANYDIWTTSIQNDGKIIIGGYFTSYNGFSINRIARLNTDGTLDGTFTLGSGVNDLVRTTATQSDGKIIIGGHFDYYYGSPINNNYICRLNNDGTLDATFNPGTAANYQVWTTTIQSDGKIIIGGHFTSYNGIPRNHIARLNTDGTLDVTFDPGIGASDRIQKASIQTDGRIIISGDFHSYNGIVRNKIARILDCTPPTIIGSTPMSICGAGSVTLSASASSGIVNWYSTAIGGTAIASGSNFTTPNISSTTTYYVDATINGCTTPIRTAVTATVNPIPTTPSISASGPTTFCQGENVILTSSTATSYLWNTNETTQSITISTSGNYSVIVTDGNGCSATSSTTTVTVNPTPTASITAGGATTFCQGGTVVLNANSGAGLTYQWRNNGNNISSATNASYIANATGSYSVVVTNSIGCTATSTATAVTVNPIPTVSFSGLSNFINYYANPSMVNGNPSGGSFTGPGISGTSFNPQTAGLGISTITYSYTNGDGCSNTASQNTIVYDTLGVVCTNYDTITTNVYDTTFVTQTVYDTIQVTVYDTLLTTVTDTLIINSVITGINPPNNLNTLKVFPNPANTHITIDYGNFTAMIGYTITIVNSIGQTVFLTPINQQTSYIDLSTWSGTGIYFVQLIDPLGTTIENRKIVLQ